MQREFKSVRSRRLRGSVSAEHLAVLAVALLGAAGMTSLGAATKVAIAGEAAGEGDSYSAATPLSAQAGAASTLVDAAELYADVVAKAPPPKRYTRLAGALRQHLYAAREGSAAELDEFMKLAPASGASTAALLHGLLTEYASLAPNTRSSAHGSNVWQALIAFDGNRWEPSGFRSPLTGKMVGLPTYYADVAEAARPSPAVKRLLERIRAADQIFRGGIEEDELARVFGSASSRGGSAAPATDELAQFLGTFEGPTSPVTVFEWQYLANPQRALSALPDEARVYLEAEVLPILRATYAKKDESLRYLTDEGEARVMARLVRGDVAGAKKALAGAKRAGAPTLPGDMAELVSFAPRLFSGGDAPFGKLRAFSEEEASTLVRFSDDVLADLRSRADGGALVADLADVLRGREWTRAAGRAEAHQTKALESLLQAVARGSEDDFMRAQGFVTQIVSDFSKDLTDELKQLLEHFRGDKAAEATKAD